MVGLAGYALMGWNYLFCDAEEHFGGLVRWENLDRVPLRIWLLSNGGKRVGFYRGWGKVYKSFGGKFRVARPA